jgi:hypothetical protein
VFCPFCKKNHNGEDIADSAEVVFWFSTINPVALNRFSNPARFWKDLLKCFKVVPIGFGDYTRWRNYSMWRKLGFYWKNNKFLAIKFFRLSRLCRRFRNLSQH